MGRHSKVFCVSVGDQRLLRGPLDSSPTRRIASHGFGLVVWSENTLCPRWMALMNPLALFVVLGLIGNWPPASVGGFARLVFRVTSVWESTTGQRPEISTFL